METLLKEKIDRRKDDLAEKLRDGLKHIANNCTSAWKKTNDLDEVLLLSRAWLPKCKLMYAVECHGVQVSSNIQADGTVNMFSRGQNLAHRPYMLNMKPELPFTLSPVYISKTDRKPSITAMHHVTGFSGKVIGCIAADFNIDDLPDEAIEPFKAHYWRQIKGDPAIRHNLFLQERINSAMDKKIDQVHDITNDLMCQRGIFHAKLHYSSSRATLWPYEKPYEYRLHVLDEIIDPDVCLVYPSHPYPDEATVPVSDITRVLNKFKELRNADETIYLRTGSLNIINAMVGLNFSCDGSHYMPVNEFLRKPDSFWFGDAYGTST